MVMRKFLWGLIVLCFYSHLGAIGSYCLYQQYNDSCIIMPMLNLPLVEKYVADGYKTDGLQFYTRKDWLGRGMKYEISWRSIFKRIEKSDDQDIKYLKEFIDKIRNENILSLPHFYQKDGKLPYVTSIDPTKNILNLLSLPWLVLDRERLRNGKFFSKHEREAFSDNMYAGLMAPCGILENGSLEYFDPEANSYKVIQAKDVCCKVEYRDADGAYLADHYEELCKLRDEGEWLSISLDWDKTFKDNKKPDYIQKYKVDMSIRDPKEKPFTIWCFAGSFASSQEEDLSFNYTSHFVYLKGLFKFMLLVLGIDRNNEVLVGNEKIVEGKNDTDGVAPYMIALQKLCNADENNQWNKKYFVKEKFLQYVIADILKKNPSLKEQCKKTVDLYMDNWKNYERLCNGEFYKSPQAKEEDNLKKFIKYLPGEEQLLAYCIMQNIQFLWYGAQKPDTLKEGGIFPWAHFGLAKLSYFLLKYHAYTKKAVKNGLEGEDVQVSFMDVWKKICAKIEMNPVKHFVNFNGHGFVVSFDKGMVKRQNRGKVYDPKTIQDLNVVISESEHGSDFPSIFYKKK